MHRLAWCHPKQVQLNGSFWHDILVVNLHSSIHPINYCQFETMNVVGDNRYTSAVVLATRSPITRHSMAKHFVIASCHDFRVVVIMKSKCCLFCIQIYFGCLVSDVHQERLRLQGDHKEGSTVFAG